MPSSEELRCSYCNQPLQLEVEKTDEEGQAVHEECYALKHANAKRRESEE